MLLLPLRPSWLPAPDRVLEFDIVLIQRHPKLHIVCISALQSRTITFLEQLWCCAWMQMHPRTQLALFVDPYSTGHQPRFPDFFLWGCHPAFCPLLCAYNQGYPTIDGESSTCSFHIIGSCLVFPHVSIRPLCPKETSVFFQLQSWACSDSAVGHGMTVAPVLHKCALSFPLPRGLRRRMRRKTKNKTRRLR